MKTQTHILYVDDDQFLLDLYIPLFEKEGYKITTIQQLNKDFVEEVIQIAPDLIMSDILMPHITGIEFLKGLKADDRTKAIPFVIYSNCAEQEDKDEAKQLGAIDYLVKAEMKPSEVVKRIKAIIMI